MLKVCLFILLLFFSNSCSIQFINGNEFENLTSENKEKVIKLKDFDNLKVDYIYEITGDQLLNELAKHERSIVYIFANGCTSENCLPLSQIENYAKSNNYSLFLVMNNYYNLESTLEQPVKSILYSVNSDNYGLEKSRKYMNAFKTDLGYFEFSKNKYLGSYLYFDKNQLIDIKVKYD
jgi:hypothetical protein